MKYFKNDLWESINSIDINESERAEEEWKVNSKLYWHEFKRLETRLNKNVFDFFSKYDFHDCTVSECKMKNFELKNNNYTSVEIVVKYGDDEWVILYNNIVKFSVNFNEDSDNFINGFGEWGYHELLMVDTEKLSHEILFSSGATILVSFFDKDISIHKK